MEIESTIKALEEKLAILQQNCDDLLDENGELKTEKDYMTAEIERLAKENQRLRTSLESSPSSEVSWWTAPAEEQGVGKPSNSSFTTMPPPGGRTRRPA